MNIYEYLDYREFIKAAIGELRSKHKLTNRAISERLGVVSPSYYRETIELGIKNISPGVAGRFAEMLQLNSDETEYLRLLVHYNQSKTEYEKTLLLQQLLPLRKGVHPDSHIIDVNEYAYMAEWQNSVIRELLPLLPGFGNRNAAERTELAKILRPKLSDKQIDDAVELLESLKFIRRNKNGDYVKTDSIIRGEKKTSVAFVTLCQLVDIGKKIINIVKPEHRSFKTVVLGLTKETYSVIEKRINDFCFEILEIAGRDKNRVDRLYNMNIQFFPLTWFPEKEK
jgi:uncharacterized protein (TIGR02147 family)